MPTASMSATFTPTVFQPSPAPEDYVSQQPSSTTFTISKAVAEAASSVTPSYSYSSAQSIATLSSLTATINSVSVTFAWDTNHNPQSALSYSFTRPHIWPPQDTYSSQTFTLPWAPIATVKPRFTTTKTITGVAHIIPPGYTTTQKAITGVAHIQVTTIQTVQGKAKITATTTQTVTGVAHITATTAQTITGVARITATATKTITGVAHITGYTNRTITGVAHIGAPATVRTITGVAHIIPPAANTWSTQEVDEWIALPSNNTQLTQELLEWIAFPPNDEQMTQELLEWIAFPPNQIQVTQVVLEVVVHGLIFPLNYIAVGNALMDKTQKYIV